MDRAALLARYADTTGWNEDTLLDLALEYIGNQQDDETFTDFLDQREVDEVPRFSHAYTIAFEVDTDHDVDDVTGEEIRDALRARLESLKTPEDWLADADSPYDSQERAD